MAELDGGRVAAMLAADAQLDVGAGLAAAFGSHLDQLANAVLIQSGEGIVLIDLVLIVGIQELAGVVTAEAEGHLGQVVGAEAEELGFLGDLVGQQSGSRDLDHGAHMILHVAAGGGDQLVGGGGHDVLHELQFLNLAYQRDHDLRNDIVFRMLLVHSQGRVDHSGGLHFGDLRIGYGQTAAAVAHHRVELVETGDYSLQLVYGDLQFAGQLYDVLFLLGNELMQRRIQETNGHGTAFQHAVHSLEVALLIRQDLVQSSLSGLGSLGYDHLADGLNAVALEEHVLGAAQTDALGAKGHSLGGVTGSISVGADLQGSSGVGPLHEAVEVAGNRSGNGGNGLAINVAGRAVDGNVVAFLNNVAGQLKFLGFLVHLDVAAAGYAAGAHTTGNNGGVRGHTAANGQNTLGGSHALDVLRRGLQTDQNDLFAVLVPGLGILGGEYHLAAGGAGRSGQALADGLGGLQSLGVKLGMEQSVQLLGLHAENSGVLRDLALVHQVYGDLQSGGSGSLAVSGLKHIQLAVLNGEFHILHVGIVLFQAVRDVGKLLVHLGHILGQLGDVAGSTDTGNHVLALGVDQVLAEQSLFTGGGVAGKGNAGTGVLVQVAEHHGLYVNSGAPAVGDFVHAAVYVGAGVVPGTEYSLDGFHQLSLRIGREILAHFLLIVGLEELDQLFHVVGVQINVVLNALLLLDLVDDDLEGGLG